MTCRFSPPCIIKLCVIIACLKCTLQLDVLKLLQRFHPEMSVCEELKHCSSFLMLNETLACKASTAASRERDIKERTRNGPNQGHQLTGTILLAKYSNHSGVDLYKLRFPKEKMKRLINLKVQYPKAVVYVPYFKKLAISCLKPKGIILSPLTSLGPQRTIYRRLAPNVIIPGRDRELFVILEMRHMQVIYSLDGASQSAKCHTESGEIFLSIAFYANTNTLFLATNLYFQRYDIKTNLIITVSNIAYTGLYLDNINHVLYAVKKTQVFSIPITGGSRRSLISSLSYNVRQLFYSDGLIFVSGVKGDALKLHMIQVYNRKIIQIDFPKSIVLRKNMNMTVCLLYP